MAKPVHLTTFSWPTQGAAEEEFRGILRHPDYGPNAEITNETHDLMLRELVDRHHDADEKIGAGIDHFYVGLTKDGDRFNVRPDAIGFWIRRIDGTTADFSFLTAIRNHGSKQNVKDAMRRSVDNDRMAYRAKRFADGPVICALSGATIHDRDQAAVIYTSPTWEQLTYRFAQTVGGWDAVEVHSGHGGVTVGTRFTEPEMEEQWLAFHDAHARRDVAGLSAAARRGRSDETAWTG